MPPIKKKLRAQLSRRNLNKRRANLVCKRTERHSPDQLADLLDDDMPGFNMTGGSNLSGRGKSRLNKTKPTYITYSKPSLPNQARRYFNIEKAWDTDKFKQENVKKTCFGADFPVDDTHLSAIAKLPSAFSLVSITMGDFKHR
ncbi:hypothetical protein EMCG_04015 [[Emmonsia] crescens]|uniref:Uncharacterized protein n=1 Tax=[Emmonsia] crescens TaxID=73230 RepID=A0A0G2HUG0_9EURO|nr:hypothetical protein EMCG_04015 [Emmonsia crescens UAMH 3008]